MDLANYTVRETSVEGAVMDIVDVTTGSVIMMPHGEGDDAKPKKMWLRLLGASSPQGKREYAQVRNRVNKRSENYVPSNDDIAREEELDAMMLAKLTVDGEVFYAGEWLKANSDNMYKIYKQSEPLRAQALEFINNPKHYLDNAKSKKD